LRPINRGNKLTETFQWHLMAIQGKPHAVAMPSLNPFPSATSGSSEHSFVAIRIVPSPSVEFGGTKDAARFDRTLN
jgi:hypothetical protein